MTRQDFDRFTKLMLTIGEATPQGKPSPEKIEIYFRCLEDMNYEAVKQNAMNHLRYEKFFPTISELRNEAQLEIQAQEDYAIIKQLCQDFLFAGFGRSGTEAIRLMLEERGKGYLMPMVRRWGAEIANGYNPTATRAQFLRAYKADAQRDRLPGSERKELPEPVKALAEKLGTK